MMMSWGMGLGMLAGLVLLTAVLALAVLGVAWLVGAIGRSDGSASHPADAQCPRPHADSGE